MLLVVDFKRAPDQYLLHAERTARLMREGQVLGLSPHIERLIESDVRNVIKIIVEEGPSFDVRVSCTPWLKG